MPDRDRGARDWRDLLRGRERRDRARARRLRGPVPALPRPHSRARARMAPGSCSSDRAQQARGVRTCRPGWTPRYCGTDTWRLRCPPSPCPRCTRATTAFSHSSCAATPRAHIPSTDLCSSLPQRQPSRPRATRTPRRHAPRTRCTLSLPLSLPPLSARTTTWPRFCRTALGVLSPQNLLRRSAARTLGQPSSSSSRSMGGKPAREHHRARTGAQPKTKCAGHWKSCTDTCSAMSRSAHRMRRHGRHWAASLCHAVACPLLSDCTARRSAGAVIGAAVPGPEMVWIGTCGAWTRAATCTRRSIWLRPSPPLPFPPTRGRGRPRLRGPRTS